MEMLAAGESWIHAAASPLGASTSSCNRHQSAPRYNESARWPAALSLRSTGALPRAPVSRLLSAVVFVVIAGVVCLAPGGRLVAAVMSQPPPPRSIPPTQYRKPTPRFRCPVCFEVRFETEEDARRAALELDGADYEGKTMQVTLNEVSEPITKVNVQGIAPDAVCIDVKKHFAERIGPVAFVGVERDNMFGEVVYERPEHAWKAKMELDGTELLGKKLRVELDCTTDRLTKVLVHGLSSAVMWQELKDHFRRAGKVVRAYVHGGTTAKIVYEDTEGARRAMARLKGTVMLGTTNKLKVTGPWDYVPGSTEVHVRGLPEWADKRALERHFRTMGKITNIFVNQAQLPPEFYLPPGPLPAGGYDPRR